jgi:hypothetical protein
MVPNLYMHILYLFYILLLNYIELFISIDKGLLRGLYFCCATL